MLQVMMLELFSIEGEHPRSPKAIFRRFILWSIVCWISAAPSFYIASNEKFDQQAMIAAVTLFSILYTIFTSTDTFDRFHRIRGVRTTLYIGYWMRIILSLVFPVAMFIDKFIGLISIVLLERTGIIGNDFVATFIITCIHGTLMNLLIMLFMLVIYPLVRCFSPEPGWREQNRAYGFEVIMPTRE